MSTPNPQPPKATAPRTNKKPAIITAVIICCFAGIFIYGSHVRTAQKVATETGGSVVFDQPISVTSENQITRDKTNGMINNVPASSINTVEEIELDEEVSTTDSALDDFFSSLTLKQEQRKEAMRVEIEEQQIKSFQNALSSPLGVEINSAVFVKPKATENEQDEVDQVDSDERYEPVANTYHNAAGNVALNNRINVNDLNPYETDLQRKMPRTPYELTTGHIITAAMNSRTVNELTGDSVATVSRTVYDSATGRYPLIPQGSKLYGSYMDSASRGQKRLGFVWHRIVFPNGQKLNIGNMTGYDSQGVSGVEGKVRTKFWSTLGNAFLISIVGGAGQALVEAADSTGSNITINMQKEFTDTTSDAFNGYLQEKIMTKPEISLDAGEVFNIIVNKDFAFNRPYDHNDVSYRGLQDEN